MREHTTHFDDCGCLSDYYKDFLKEIIEEFGLFHSVKRDKKHTKCSRCELLHKAMKICGMT
jgi:hypothetical protein